MEIKLSNDLICQSKHFFFFLYSILKYKLKSFEEVPKPLKSFIYKRNRRQQYTK